MTPKERWILRTVEPARLDDLRANPDVADLPPLIHHLLAQREICTPEHVQRFLRPLLRDLSNPFLIPDMKPAVERILQAIDNREKVTIYGDYDVDGVTSITLMSAILRAYGLAPNAFIPRRTEEGYGISLEGARKCFERDEPDLLIAVDCGTTSIKEVAWVREQGVDVVICDHHEPSPEGRPPCQALVNPKCGDSFQYLCTAGVVFKVIHALLKQRPNPHFDLQRYLDIVAVGTVADIVPLVDENRILVSKGLYRLQQTDHCGLAALKRETRLNGNVYSSDIGFRLGPRLNAAGRVDTAEVALSLLQENDPAQAHDLARLLDEKNRERQQLELKTYTEARDMASKEFDPSQVSIVVSSSNWHPGVVGIVASRLSREFYRPTFIIAIDKNGRGKGSGRSIEDICLVTALNDCCDVLDKGGGHSQAAGLSVASEKIPLFKERFEKAVRSQLDEDIVAKLYVDAEVRLDQMDFNLLDSYEMLEPFGAGNPQPLLMARGVDLAQAPRVVGEKHLKLNLRQGSTVRPAIYFGANDLDLPPTPWDVAFNIRRNEFRGTVSLQICINSVRAASEL